jgi:acyl carrier protein
VQYYHEKGIKQMKDDVRQFVIESLEKMQLTGVTGETSLGPNGLDLESLTIAELAIQIEDQFGFEINEDDTERMALMTIDELAAEVASAVSAQEVSRPV